MVRESVEMEGTARCFLNNCGGDSKWLFRRFQKNNFMVQFIVLVHRKRCALRRMKKKFVLMGMIPMVKTYPNRSVTRSHVAVSQLDPFHNLH